MDELKMQERCKLKRVANCMNRWSRSRVCISEKFLVSNFLWLFLFGSSIRFFSLREMSIFWYTFSPRSRVLIFAFLIFPDSKSVSRKFSRVLAKLYRDPENFIFIYLFTFSSMELNYSLNIGMSIVENTFKHSLVI